MVGELPATRIKDRGASVVAIEPNDPKAITIDELDSSDISDRLEKMKIRAPVPALDLSLIFMTLYLYLSISVGR
jgi:hypothetical protein